MRSAGYRRLDEDHRVVDPLEGASLRETLLEVLASAGADRLEVRGVGRVDGVRLVGGAKGGACDVMSLTGSAERGEVRLSFVGTDAAGVVIAGKMVDARAVDCSLMVDLFAALQPSPTGSASTSTVQSGATMGWKEVKAASLQAEVDAAPELSAEPPRPGDTITHASFGVCLVEKLEEDEDFVLVRTPQNRLLRLSLEVLQPELVSETEGKRAFRSRAKQKPR